jgi:hypothetical protein
MVNFCVQIYIQIVKIVACRDKSQSLNSSAVQKLRERAHSDLGFQLMHLRGPRSGVELPHGLFPGLLDWALVELRLNVVSSFGAFAVLLRAVAGAEVLVLAGALYAAAALHPKVVQPMRVSPLALAEMAELNAALADATLLARAA